MKQTIPVLRKALLVLFAVLFSAHLFAQGQNITVRGIVLDNLNQPLPGVSVLIDGTTTGTVTGATGRFTVSATRGQTLVFRFLGYQEQRVAVNSEGLSIVLAPTNVNLNEVVVTTALGVKKKEQNIGYSTTEIRGDLVTKARDLNPITGLTGRVAGLTVGPSAEFFGRPQVVLRGSTDLLYVVDGVPINSDTYNFSPDDIDTYTVLKGPNAAALYGFRGINGAIIITTKRGTRDKKGWTVDFNTSNQFEHGFIANPSVQTQYGRGTNYAYSYGDVLYDNKQRLQEYGPRFDGQLVKQYDSPWDPVTQTRTATPWIARGANNFNKFVQTGFLTTNNLALAASGSNYDVRISYSHAYQQGLFPNTRLNSDVLNLNSGYDITPKLRIEGNINLNLQYSPNIPDVSYGPNSYAYMFKVYGSSDYNINDLKNIYKGPQGVQDLVQYAPEYGRENSAWFIAKKWLRSHQKTDVYGYVRAIYKFSDHLNLALRSQVTTWNEVRTEQVPASTNLNTYLPWYYFGWYGDYREDRRNLVENNNDLILSYTHRFGGFDLSALVGASDRSFSYNSLWGTTKDLSIPNVYTLANSQNPVIVANFGSRMQVYSGFYSVDLGYKSYLNINTTNRVDHLSTLPGANATYFYPSVSLSTVLTNYIHNTGFLSFLKLRGSYANVKGGLTSASIPDAYSATSGQSSSSLLGYGTTHTTSYDGPNYINSNSATPSTIYNGSQSVSLGNTITNSNLKPYSVTSIEAGVDMKFIRNRLGLDATYFQTTNGPVIFPLPVAPSTTFTNQLVNGVTTTKKGIELTLTGSALRSARGLNWDIIAVWSTYKERLKSIYNGSTSLDQNNHIYHIGDRLDAIYSTKFVRDPSGNIVNNSGGLPLQSPGGESNQGLLGYGNPDYSFGINNRFSYRSFSFSFQFDGRIGGKIYDQVYYHGNNGGTSAESASGAYGVARLKEWQSTSEGTVKATPAFVGPGVVIASGTPVYAGGQITNATALTFAPNTTAVTVQSYLSSGIGGNFDEYYMVSKSYAKLREVVIGYSVPGKYLQNSIVKRISISLVGRNLLYFAHRKDIDLDQYAAGYNSSDRSLQGQSSNTDLQSVTARRYGFNLNVGF